MANMDIEMDLNGHSQPLQPSSSELDTTSLDASNIAASISNSESTMPAKLPVTLPSDDTLQPVQAPLYDVQMVDQQYSEPSELSLPQQNGTEHSQTLEKPLNGTIQEGEANDNNHSTSSSNSFTEPSRLSIASHLVPQSTMVSQQSMPLDAPVTTSSLLTEALVQPTPTLLSDTESPSLEMSSIPNQAPTSDLRTSQALSEAITAEDVTKIEPEMEQKDLTADAELDSYISVDGSKPLQRPVTPPAPAHLPSDQLLPSHSEQIDEGVEMDASYENVLDTIIAQPSQSLPSPPPAPQPAPATLPSDKQSEPSLLPLEQPQEPPPTPAASAPVVEPTVDQTMSGITPPPVKVARERDEDSDESQPLAKRAKTDSEADQTEFKVPDIPSNAQSPSATNGATSSAYIFTDPDDSITLPRLAHMKKIISNLKKGNASAPFRLPVDAVALKIPQYHDIVKTPMDLGKVDTKLKNGEYSNVHDFVNDFELIVNNCITFNGVEHPVTQMAIKMQSSFNNQMAHMPRAGVVEPTREEKRLQKLKTEPTRSAPPRRPSISTPAPRTGSARSPSTANAAQTFAVGPEGVPLIRRDSNIQDGRPKRAIVPPKRNNEFSGGRPKKKKYELQLRFCEEMLKEIMATKNWPVNQYFMFPVDPVALNIPTYFQVIKKPMDLGTVKQKLDGNVYEKAKEFEEDVRLIFKNCYKFNPEGEMVNAAGHKLEELFEKKWAAKDDWIASREPTSETQSVEDEDEDEDDEESEEAEEEDEEDDERAQKIIQLQKQIEAMSRQMGELAQPKKKSKSTPPVPSKKSKSSKPKKEKGSTFPNLKPKEKKKADKKSKPEKERYVNISHAEKQYISNGISQLPDKQMMEALKIIQQNVPHLRNTHETEIELDIDEVPNHVLHKLLTFVKKYAGPPPEELKGEPSYAAAAPSGKPKKNKPMSKHEQEQQIEELKGKLGQYTGSNPLSPDPVQSVETGNESSEDDDADSEESEEE